MNNFVPYYLTDNSIATNLLPSQISEGCRCLAKSTDEVWYPATVEDVCDDHQVNVKFDAGGTEMTVLVEHIKPITGKLDAGYLSWGLLLFCSMPDGFKSHNRDAFWLD